MSKDSVIWPHLISKEPGTDVVPGRRGNRYDKHLARVCQKRFDQGHIAPKRQSRDANSEYSLSGKHSARTYKANVLLGKQQSYIVECKVYVLI